MRYELHVPHVAFLHMLSAEVDRQGWNSLQMYLVEGLWNYIEMLAERPRIY